MEDMIVIELSNCEEGQVQKEMALFQRGIRIPLERALGLPPTDYPRDPHIVIW
jgi:hypothetical protein